MFLCCKIISLKDGFWLPVLVWLPWPGTALTEIWRWMCPGYWRSVRMYVFLDWPNWTLFTWTWIIIFWLCPSLFLGSLLMVLLVSSCDSIFLLLLCLKDILGNLASSSYTRKKNQIYLLPTSSPDLLITLSKEEVGW